VSLVELFASGYQIKNFTSHYISADRINK